MLPLVEQLAATWRSISELGATLSETEWKRPTGCPGWTVQDQVAHLIDFESHALGRPRPDHAVGEVPHARNDMGRVNEIGVDVRRVRSGAEVLAEFDEVTAARLAQLSPLAEDALDTETTTPIGPGTIRDLLTLRIMDTWSHEQDIRRAVGRPGHLDGPVVATAVEYWSRFLPYAVGKLAQAPEGSTVVFVVDDLPAIPVAVEGGRGKLAEAAPPSPTVRLRMGPGTLAALVGGRADADPGAVEVEGDEVLGRRIASNLGFMP